MSDDHPDTDAVQIAAKEVLLEAMHDTSLPLSTRVDAAISLLQRWPGRHHYVPPVLIIRIECQGIETADVKVQADTDASVLDHLDQVKGWH